MTYDCTKRSPTQYIRQYKRIQRVVYTRRQGRGGPPRKSCLQARRLYARTHKQPRGGCRPMVIWVEFCGIGWEWCSDRKSKVLIGLSPCEVHLKQIRSRSQTPSPVPCCWCWRERLWCPTSSVQNPNPSQQPFPFRPHSDNPHARSPVQYSPK